MKMTIYLISIFAQRTTPPWGVPCSKVWYKIEVASLEFHFWGFQDVTGEILWKSKMVTIESTQILGQMSQTDSFGDFTSQNIFDTF